MNHGEIMQIGTPDEIYNQPQNLFTAEFIGSPKVNIFKGKDLKEISDLTSLSNSTKAVAIRPDDLIIDESKSNAKLINIENLGHEFLYHLEINKTRFISRSKNKLDLKIGITTGFGINYDNMLQYDEKGQLIND